MLAEIEDENWEEGAERQVEDEVGRPSARKLALRRKLARQASCPVGLLDEMLAEEDDEDWAQAAPGKARQELREAATGATERRRPADAAADSAQPSTQHGSWHPSAWRMSAMSALRPSTLSRPTLLAAPPLSPETSTATVDTAAAPAKGESKGSSPKSSHGVGKWRLSSKMTKGELVLAEIERTDTAEDDHIANRPSQFSSSVERRGKLLKQASRGQSGTLNTVERYGACGRIVASNHFDAAITIVVCLNALLIGAQVQHSAVSDKTVQTFEVMEYIFTFVFTLELCARVSVHRFDFFANPEERWWNVFDLFLVGLCLIDAAFNLGVGTEGGVEGHAGKVGRAIRLLRIIRIIRVVRKLPQLRVMLHMIISSMQSLFWVLVIMVGLIYMVAVVLTQGATYYLRGDSAPTTDEYLQVQSMYGSLFDTMYTLFQCMSGGVSWGKASQPLRGPGWLLEAIVISFVFFMLFAVQNIVNGVFVDSAIELAKRDRSMMTQKYLEENADKERHAIELMTLMDKDGDQEITFEEFLESLKEPEVRDYISALDVDVGDAKVFFQMLDRDGSGSVDIHEFMSGMRKFRGEAKSVDIHMMLHQNKKLFHLVRCLVGTLWQEWEEEEEEEEELDNSGASPPPLPQLTRM